MDKIDVKFPKRKKQMNSLKINVKMLKGNLIIWRKYRWNIEKWMFGMLTTLTF